MPSTTRTPREPPVLMVVDDDPRVRRSFARMLAQQGYDVVAVATPAEALKTVRERPVALALVDIVLADDASGADLIRELRRAAPATEVIAVTGHGGADVAFEVLNDGASDYFEKPIRDWKRFHHVIRRSLEMRAKDAEIRALRDRIARLSQLAGAEGFSELIGNSPAMQALKEQILQVAPLDIPVLITGESGVGKERVARALHAHSAHASGPFVPINCAGLNPELLESELFGHEKGAFTGAQRAHAGLCEVAAGGTLFLDEIGELPIGLQAKLLRMLNEKEFRRVGGTEIRPLRARVVAATNVDLERAIEQGRFRRDLYFRLNAFEIRVPPLRERREDVHLLAYYFLRKYNAEFGRNVRRIGDDALAWLQQREFRANNVRELERLVQRAVVVAGDDDVLRLGDFLLPGRGGGRPADARGDQETGVPVEDLLDLPYKEAKQIFLERFTRRYLRHHLSKCDQNITRAAESSGMLRPNFSRLMSRVGIRSLRERTVRA